MSVASPLSTYEHFFLAAWNKAHPDTGFNIKSYNNVKDDDLLRAISSGKIDSALISPASYNTIIRELEITNLRLTPPVFIEDTYFMLAQNETALCEDCDNAIESLLEDGTLGKLSEQYLGGDMFAQYAAQFKAQKMIIQ
ncbi:hypothetical protein FACS1894161_4850 [Spirochaetia bacterium]|nr:hypothetical protein FACS1894161_4850 [Spirochaetia bacterium]